MARKTALLRFLTFQLLFQQKNEENNINKLNATLKKLDYPEVNYEVIIVDDSSNDDKFSLAKKLTNEIEILPLLVPLIKKPRNIRGFTKSFSLYV